MSSTVRLNDGAKRSLRQAQADDPLLTVREAAGLLKCHVQHVYRLCALRQLPHYKPKHVGLRFRLSELTEFVDRGRRKPISDSR